MYNRGTLLLPFLGAFAQRATFSQTKSLLGALTLSVHNTGGSLQMVWLMVNVPPLRNIKMCRMQCPQAFLGIFLLFNSRNRAHRSSLATTRSTDVLHAWLQVILWSALKTVFRTLCYLFGSQQPTDAFLLRQQGGVWAWHNNSGSLRSNMEIETLRKRCLIERFTMHRHAQIQFFCERSLVIHWTNTYSKSRTGFSGNSWFDFLKIRDFANIT